MTRKKKEHDFNVTAFNIVQKLTGQDEPKHLDPEPELIDGKNPYAVILGRRGGLKGVKARAAKLTPEQRKEIAQKAARKRWDKKTA